MQKLCPPKPLDRRSEKWIKQTPLNKYTLRNFEMQMQWVRCQRRFIESAAPTTRPDRSAFRARPRREAVERLNDLTGSIRTKNALRTGERLRCCTRHWLGSQCPSAAICHQFKERVGSSQELVGYSGKIRDRTAI